MGKVYVFTGKRIEGSLDFVKVDKKDKKGGRFSILPPCE